MKTKIIWKLLKNNAKIRKQFELKCDFIGTLTPLCRNWITSAHQYFLFFYITGSIKRKKKKWCIYYWVIISRKKFVINRAFQEFCLICQKDKGKLHKSERLKVCVVKKSRVILLRYSLISKAYEKTMIDFRF